MRQRSDQSARARGDRPYQLWHPLGNPTSLFFHGFILLFLSLSLFLSALLAAVNPLSSAGCNDAAIGGTLSRAVPVLVNLWMSTEAKSYRYLPRAVFTNGRRYAKVVRWCWCIAHDTEGGTFVRRLFRSERKCMRLLEKRADACSRARARLFVRVRYIKRGETYARLSSSMGLSV